MKTNKYLINLLIILLLVLTGCKNPFRYTDAREIPVNADERVQKNIEEGRGIQILGGKKKGEYLILHRQTNYGERRLRFWIL